MSRRLILFIGLIFLMKYSALSQSHPKRFHHLTYHDGFSQSTVQAILQDSGGYLWPGARGAGYIVYNRVWKYIDTQHRAIYTNLSSGTYVFKVKSSNQDGVWSAGYTSLLMQIDPPFWRTAWFVVLMVIFIILVFFGLYRYRLRHIRIQNIRLEKKVRERTKELQLANETKNRLFSILGHDLRNYASSFIGFTGLLKESAKENNLEEMKEYTMHLDHAASQFMDFLQNLLDWAKEQSNRIQYRPETVEVEKIVRYCVNKIESEASKKNISIESALPPDLKIFTDTGMLTIIIYNMLNNAVKFSYEGSKVEISAAKTETDSVEIVIRDYGVGMDNETAQKLFSDEEFFSTRGTSGEKGTGLGFTLSNNLIKKINGKLTIDSHLGEDTAVKIIIPSIQNELSDAS